MCTIMRLILLSLVFMGCSDRKQQYSRFHSLLMSVDETHIAFNNKERTSVIIRKEKEILNLLDIALSGKVKAVIVKTPDC